MTTDTVKLNKDLILASSIVVYLENEKLATEFYKAYGNTIVFPLALVQEVKGKMIRVSYRYFQVKTAKKFSLLDSSLMKRSAIGSLYGYELTPADLKNSKLIASNNLDYNGSFSRGFSVGNTQSLVVNSKFDLQLQGEIGNGITINAAISDDNVPIQAEGNTQVLQEFDRVFIELNKDKTSLLAGDYSISKPNSYFMNYAKKLKGIGIRNIFESANQKLDLSGNVASSRGKFARQTIKNREGNQGPYKLTGNANERFIIILSGTEKIYFNGQLIKRGQEYDYTIDYNLAEVTFTPNRIIAKETRIIVEYEYTDQNYFRSFYTTNLDYKWKRTGIAFNYYSEQDSKQSTSQIDLDSFAINTLSNSGDDEDKYILSSIRRATSEESIVKYELLNNPNFPMDRNEYFLLFSNDPTKALYTSGFSETGVGKGSYIIDQKSSFNGRVYKFVGAEKGNYEPVNRLIPPEQKQMIDLSVSQEFSKYGSLYANAALSSFDKNRFSSIGDGDNVGLAFFLKLKNEHIINRNEKDSSSFFYQMNIENTAATFNSLNQYRDPEFVRDWNFKSTSIQRDLIFNLEAGLKRSNAILSFNFGRFKSGDNFLGNKLEMDFSYTGKRLNFSGNPSFITTKGISNTTSFLRPNFVLSETIHLKSKTRFGIELEAEDNEKNFIDGQLDSSSYRFYYTKSFMSIGDANSRGIKISYNKRIDDFANFNSLKKTIDIQEIEVTSNLNRGSNQLVNVNLKYRDFDVLDERLAKGDKSKRTLLGSIVHNASFLKGGFVTNSNYQVSSGQEPKVEFVFQKVQTLRGEYVYLGNDSIKNKNINDFRYDPTNPLASYTRFSLANNEFSTTNNISFNQTFKIEPARWMKKDSLNNKNKFSFLKKLNNNSLIRLANKFDGNSSKFSYFNFNANDTSIVSYQRNIVSTTFFNRGGIKYDLAYVYKNNGAKINQVSGFEERSFFEHEFKIRYNVISSLDILVNAGLGEKNFQSKLFQARNFEMDQQRGAIEVNYRFGTKLRVVGNYSITNSQQTINDLENALKNDFTTTLNYRESKNGALDLSISTINIKYKGSNTSLIQYDILEGLQPGVNVLWMINYTRRLSKLIDLTLNYEGRKTGASAIINVGRIQAKATF
jgi:hypothetical protein